MAGHALIRNNDTGVVSTSDGVVVGTVPDAGGEPDGAWLQTASGAAVWIENPPIVGGDAATPGSPIQLRADTAANWTAEDPTLALGELGLEADTGKVKFGDGATAWSSLPYFGASTGVDSIDGITGPVTLVAGANVTITDNDPSPGDITIDATGGGAGWMQKFYDDGSSLAAWTSRTGTWASSGGAIVQSDTAENNAHLERTAGNPYPLVAVKMVASITFPVSGAGGGSQRAGFCLDHLSGAGIRNGEITVWLRRDNSGAGLIEYDLFGSGGSTQAIQSLSLGTAYSLTVVRVGNYFDVYVDGVLKCSFEGGGSRQNYDTVSLVTRTAKASFDDIYLYAALGP